MAVVSIDRASGCIPDRNGRIAFVGSGFATLSPQLLFRRAAFLATSARSTGNFSPSSGGYASAAASRKALAEAYFSQRNEDTGYVDPPANIADGVWESGSGSQDASFADGASAIVDDNLASVGPTVFGPGSCVVYPRNSATNEYGSPFVLERPRVFWHEECLWPRYDGHFRNGQSLLVYGRSFHPPDAAGTASSAFARRVSDGTVFELATVGHEVITGVGNWSTSTCAVEFRIQRQDNGAMLPIDGEYEEYDFCISRNTNVYGVCALNPESDPNPIGRYRVYPESAFAESFLIFDATGSFTYELQSAPDNEYRIGPQFGSDENALAIAALMCEAFRLHKEDPEGRRVRALLPPGRILTSRRIVVPPGVVLDLNGCELVVDESFEFAARAVPSDSDPNSLDSTLPPEIASAFRASPINPGLVFLTPRSSVSGEKYGGCVEGGRLVLCRNPLPNPLNVPACGVDAPAPDEPGGENWSAVQDLKIDSYSLTNRPNECVRVGNGATSSKPPASRILVERVEGRGALGVSTPPSGQAERYIVRACEFHGASGSPVRGQGDRIIGKWCLIRGCRWKHRQRGLLSQSASVPYQPLLWDCACESVGMDITGSEQILFEQVGTQLRYPIETSVGGDPSVLRFSVGTASTDWMKVRPGCIVAVVDGPGKYQWRKIASASHVSSGNYNVTLDRPFTVAIDETSRILFGIAAVEPAVVGFHQRDGVRSILSYGSVIGLVAARCQFEQVGCAIHLYGDFRENENRMGICWDAVLVQNTIKGGGLGVLIDAVYRTTGGGSIYTHVGVHDHRGSYHDCGWVMTCNPFHAGASSPSTDSAGGVIFGLENCRFAGNLWEAKRTYGATNANSQFPTRKVMGPDPISCDDQLKFKHLFVSQMSLNGYPHTSGGASFASPLAASRFYGELASGEVGAPEGLPYPGSEASDFQTTREMVLSIEAPGDLIVSIEEDVAAIRAKTDVLLVDGSGRVTVGSNADKSGYSLSNVGLDEIAVDRTPSSSPATFKQAMDLLFCWFFNRKRKVGGQLLLYGDNSTDLVSTQIIVDSGSVEEVGKAS